MRIFLTALDAFIAAWIDLPDEVTQKYSVWNTGEFSHAKFLKISYDRGNPRIDMEYLTCSDFSFSKLYLITTHVAPAIFKALKSYWHIPMLRSPGWWKNFGIISILWKWYSWTICNIWWITAVSKNKILIFRIMIEQWSTTKQWLKWD